MFFFLLLQSFLTLPTVFSKNAFRNGAIQLVIHTLDPIAEGKKEYKIILFHYLNSIYLLFYFRGELHFVIWWKSSDEIVYSVWWICFLRLKVFQPIMLKSLLVFRKYSRLSLSQTFNLFLLSKGLERRGEVRDVRYRV